MRVLKLRDSASMIDAGKRLASLFAPQNQACQYFQVKYKHSFKAPFILKFKQATFRSKTSTHPRHHLSSKSFLELQPHHYNLCFKNQVLNTSSQVTESNVFAISLKLPYHKNKQIPKVENQGVHKFLHKLCTNRLNLKILTQLSK